MGGSGARIWKRVVVAVASMPIALVGLVPTLASAATNKADVFVGVSGPSSAYVGQTMSYEISYGNTGPDVATGVVITDTMPAGTSFAAYASDPCWSQSGSTLTCNIGSAGVNAVGMIALALIAPSNPGTVSDTAQIAMDEHDHTPADNTSTFTTSVTVPTQADVTISLSANPTSINVGDQVAFGAGVVNNGPAPATSVTVSDTLPMGLTYVPSMSDSRCTASGQTVTCAIGSLGAGAVDEGATITAQATSSGAFTDTATATADQPDPDVSNNSASATVQVSGPADMAIAISGPSSVDVRTVNAYTFSVSNLGSDAAGTVTLDISLPAQMSPAGWTSPQGSCQGSFTPPSYHCDLGGMAAGASIEVVIDAYAYQDGSGTLTASVGSDRPDPNQSNNSAALSTVVNSLADLQMSGGPAIVPGKAGRSTVTFTVIVYNGGPSTASSVKLSDSWSATTKKLQMSSLSITQGTCLIAASSADCSIGTLDPGSTATLTVTFTTQGSGTVTDTGTASGAQKDPDNTNNTVVLTAST